MTIFKVIIFFIIFLLSTKLGHYVNGDFKKRKYILIGMLLLTLGLALFFNTLPGIIKYLTILNGVSMTIAGFEVSRIKMMNLKIKY